MCNIQVLQDGIDFFKSFLERMGFSNEILDGPLSKMDTVSVGIM